jgi:hypothetical protein
VASPRTGAHKERETAARGVGERARGSGWRAAGRGPATAGRIPLGREFSNMATRRRNAPRPATARPTAPPRLAPPGPAAPERPQARSSGSGGPCGHVCVCVNVGPRHRPIPPAQCAWAPAVRAEPGDTLSGKTGSGGQRRGCAAPLPRPRGLAAPKDRRSGGGGGGGGYGGYGRGRGTWPPGPGESRCAP